METDPETIETDRPVQLDDGEELDALVDAHEVVLVEFYTEGCPICQSMEPVMGTVARATDAVVGVCNPRSDPPLVDRFEVRSVPLLVLFVDGEPLARTADGFLGVDEVVAFVDDNAP